MLGVVWDYYSSKLKGKQNKQNTSPRSYKIENKILANPGLAWSGFEQPGPGQYAIANGSKTVLKYPTTAFKSTWKYEKLAICYRRPRTCSFHVLLGSLRSCYGDAEDNVDWKMNLYFTYDSQGTL